MTPYFQDAAVTLYHGDCREILPTLRADVVFTDPPYNCGKNYGATTDDAMPWQDWCKWFDAILDDCKTSAPNVFAFLSQTAAMKYERYGVHERDWCLVWQKPLSLSICAAPFMPHWEPIFYWGQQKRTRDGGALWGSDVISCNVEIGMDRWGHPTPKPVELMVDLVKRVDGVVLDPFAGSGTTLAAAKQLGRRAIGIEINEAYCETAAARLRDTGVSVRASRNQIPMVWEPSV